MRARRLVVWMACVGALGIDGCGGSGTHATAALRPDQRPVRTGRGLRYELAAVSSRVARRVPVAGMHCERHAPRPYAIHLELFARRLVVPVPAGIGVAPPQRRSGVYVLGGACVYGLRTLEPTGVVRVSPAGAGLGAGAAGAAGGRAPTLADLFAVWGQPLSATRLAGFRDHVLAFVDGRAWPAAPGSIPLRRHAEIVLEVGGRLPPHPSYRFPPGL